MWRGSLKELVKESALRIKGRVNQNNVAYFVDMGLFPPAAENRESFWHLRMNGFGSIKVIAMITLKNSLSGKGQEMGRMKYAERRKNRVDAPWVLK